MQGISIAPATIGDCPKSTQLLVEQLAAPKKDPELIGLIRRMYAVNPTCGSSTDAR